MRGRVWHYDGPKRVEFVEAADGTRLCVTVCGEGERALVLSPGLATPPTVYDYVIQRFAPHLRVITWDMRGSFRSGRPVGGAAAQRVEDSAADLEAIAAAEQLDRFVLGGWSMGVQVSLEYAHRHPEQVDGLLLMNGGFGHVLDYVMGLRPLGRALQRAVGMLVRAPGVTSRLSRFVLERRLTMHFLFATGVVASANREFIEDVVRQFGTLDFGYYFPMMLALHAHTAEAWLHEVRAPTVVTAGTRDRMTPVSSAERLASSIPGAELVIIPRGTHYTPLEFPQRVNEAIEGLLRRVYPDLAL
jgi:pimeloyl-ACP methyl ester carboxylesterase